MIPDSTPPAVVRPAEEEPLTTASVIAKLRATRAEIPLSELVDAAYLAAEAARERLAAHGPQEQVQEYPTPIGTVLAALRAQREASEAHAQAARQTPRTPIRTIKFTQRVSPRPEKTENSR